MATTASRRTGLFGGAMCVNLPMNYQDVSKIRQVPDHQEIWVCSTGTTSICFDLTERVDEPSTEEALKYHLEDVVDSGDSIRVWSTSKTHMAKFPHQTPTCCLLATTHPSSAISAKSNAPSFTALVLTLVRLETQATDIVVTVNVPHYPGRYDPSEIDLEEGQPGKLIKEGMAIRDMVLQSLEVVNWGLFHGKGGS